MVKMVKMGLCLEALLWIALRTLPCISGTVFTSFAADYFRDKGIKQVAVFACWDAYGRVEFARGLMLSGLRVSYFRTERRPADEADRHLRVNYYALGAIVDLDCEAGAGILSGRSSNAYNESYFWLITRTAEDVPYEPLGRLPLSINAEVTLAMRDLGGADSYRLYDVYNPSYRHGGRLNVTYLGHWSPGNGLVLGPGQYKYKRRGDLHGMPLNLSIAVNHPPRTMSFESYIRTPVDRHLDTMHRFNYALILHFRDYYNFTPAMPSDRMNLLRGTTWGYKANGTFNGILGDMARGIVDISATPFRWKIERLDVMEYTVQTWNAGPMVIFRHPKRDELSNQFYKPFSDEVWSLTLVLALTNWLVFYLAVKVEHRYREAAGRPLASLDTIPASETFLITTAAICQQGLSDGPRFYSGRGVFLSIFLWALLQYQFYAASVVGSLLSVSSRFITTPRALLESSLDLGVEDIEYNRDFFNTDTDPVVRELNRRKVMANRHRQRDAYFTPEEGLRKVQKGGFAFQVDIATAYKIIEDTFNDEEICDLQEIKLLYPAVTSVGVARHSPFKKMVTYGMRQIVETGLSSRLRRVWHHRRPRCPESHNSLPTAVTIKDFCPALLVLLVGHLLALLVMICESLVDKWRRHK